jgi:hypothetical protein
MFKCDICNREFYNNKKLISHMIRCEKRDNSALNTRRIHSNSSSTKTSKRKYSKSDNEQQDSFLDEDKYSRIIERLRIERKTLKDQLVHSDTIHMEDMTKKDAYYNNKIKDLNSDILIMVNKIDDLYQERETNIETDSFLRKKYTKKMAKIRLENGNNEKELENNKNLLDDLTNSHSISIEELKTNHASSFDELNTRHVNSYNELKTNHASSFDELNTRHVNSYNELTTNHSISIDELKTSHASSFNELKIVYDLKTEEFTQNKICHDKEDKDKEKVINDLTNRLEQRIDGENKTKSHNQSVIQEFQRNVKIYTYEIEKGNTDNKNKSIIIENLKKEKDVISENIERIVVDNKKMANVIHKYDGDMLVDKEKMDRIVVDNKKMGDLINTYKEDIKSMLVDKKKMDRIVVDNKKMGDLINTYKGDNQSMLVDNKKMRDRLNTYNGDIQRMLVDKEKMGDLINTYKVDIQRMLVDNEKKVNMMSEISKKQCINHCKVKKELITNNKDMENIIQEYNKELEKEKEKNNTLNVSLENQQNMSEENQNNFKKLYTENGKKEMNKSKKEYLYILNKNLKEYTKKEDELIVIRQSLEEKLENTVKSKDTLVQELYNKEVIYKNSFIEFKGKIKNDMKEKLGVMEEKNKNMGDNILELNKKIGDMNDNDNNKLNELTVEIYELKIERDRLNNVIKDNTDQISELSDNVQNYSLYKQKADRVDAFQRKHKEVAEELGRMKSGYGTTLNNLKATISDLNTKLTKSKSDCDDNNTKTQKITTLEAKLAIASEVKKQCDSIRERLVS